MPRGEEGGREGGREGGWEMYKAYENKSAESIQERVDDNYASR